MPFAGDVTCVRAVLVPWALGAYLCWPSPSASLSPDGRVASSTLGLNLLQAGARSSACSSLSAQ